MSRTNKSSPYWSGSRAIYKGYRSRRERARLREYLGRMQPNPDCPDLCRFDCEHCGTEYADDAGPKYQLDYWDAWAFD